MSAKREVQAVILHGSLAGKNYTGSSDADILIIVDRIQERFLDRSSFFMDATVSIPIEPLVYNIDEIRARLNRDPLVRNAVRNGLILFERDGIVESLRNQLGQ